MQVPGYEGARYIIAAILLYWIIKLLYKSFKALFEVITVILGTSKKITKKISEIPEDIAAIKREKEELKNSKERRDAYFRNPERLESIKRRRKSEVDECVKINMSSVDGLFKRAKK